MDASSQGIAASLYQEDDEGQWLPVSLTTRTLSHNGKDASTVCIFSLLDTRVCPQEVASITTCLRGWDSPEVYAGSNNRMGTQSSGIHKVRAYPFSSWRTAPYVVLLMQYWTPYSQEPNSTEHLVKGRPVLMEFQSGDTL